MPTLPPKADIRRREWHVCFGPETDIAAEELAKAERPARNLLFALVRAQKRSGAQLRTLVPLAELFSGTEWPNLNTLDFAQKSGNELFVLYLIV
jgi:hypothetical protein